MSKVSANVVCLMLALAVAGCCMTDSVLAVCPSVLMFDGVNIRMQNNAMQARYWGRVVGVQGFFLNNVMAYWQQDVGASPAVRAWRQAKQFQETFARYGVTDNFIKVAIWKPHDWHSEAQNATVVSHFAYAAALARYAGFKGIALDLEPYVPVWGGAAGGEGLARTVQAEGQAIAQAMNHAYPDMTLVLIKDGLYWAARKEGYHGGYGLSVPFIRGLLSVPWSQVVIATEQTYENHQITRLTERTRSRYTAFVRRNHLPPQNLSVAPGLWPLGESYENKSARVGASDFERHLRSAMKSTAGYVWIYGFGSAWQSEGPYGKGQAVGNLAAYTRAVLSAEHGCAATVGVDKSHKLAQ